MTTDPVAEAQHQLNAYGLRIGQAIEVDLLGAGRGGPLLVEGTIVGAFPGALVIESTDGATLARVPWAAIACIRTTSKPHPGL